MTVGSPAEAIANAAHVAASAIKRGLGERGILDIQAKEVHLLMVLLLARVGDLDEDLNLLYVLFDVLDDASCLNLPSEAEFDKREGEIQRLLTLLHDTSSIKAQKSILIELGKGLLKHAPPKQLNFSRCPQPWQLWRMNYTKTCQPPKRNTKPPPPEPNNVWFFLTPDRSPMDVPRTVLSKLFKKWMLANHPDKGGNEATAARVSALYSQAMARGLTADGANPEENDKMDEDSVYRQQQRLAEPEWSAYKRAVSERAYCASATYLDQRLLKAVRWVLIRREKQRLFMQEVSAANAAGPEPVSRTVLQQDTLAASRIRDCDDMAAVRARDVSPRPTSPAMAFGKRVESHTPRNGAMGGGSTNAKGFFQAAFGGHANTPSRPLAVREPLRPVQGPSSDIVFVYSTAYGEGLTIAFPKQTGRFTIQARDRLFRGVPCSPDPFHVVVRGKQIVSPTTSANKDGSIGVEYCIAVCGTYKVCMRSPPYFRC